LLTEEKYKVESGEESNRQDWGHPWCIPVRGLGFEGEDTPGEYIWGLDYYN